jgi:hypothetical protein
VAPPFPSRTEPSPLLSSPFTFAAQLTGFATQELTGPPLFTASLTGSAIGSITLLRTSSGDLLPVGSRLYVHRREPRSGAGNADAVRGRTRHRSRCQATAVSQTVVVD